MNIPVGINREEGKNYRGEKKKTEINKILGH
ncbi:MAG: hypothetical protein ACI8RD_003763 [Bacillariaceae sp.]|jgi:hypothetical protein